MVKVNFLKLKSSTFRAYNANGEKVSSLAFTAASQADEGQYSCTMKYNDIDETKVLQPWLKIMSKCFSGVFTFSQCYMILDPGHNEKNKFV